MQERKNVIITGANKGIGQGITQCLAKKEDYKIIMTCLHLEHGKESKEKMGQNLSDQKLCVDQLDISDPKSIQNFVNKLKQKKMRIDVLVNNVACYVEKEQVNMDIFKKNFNTNFYGTIQFTEKMLPLMNDNGKIIFMGDYVARDSFKNISSQLRSKKKDLKKRI